MGQEINYLIRDGKIYDGTGGEPFTADIAIAGDRIAFVVNRHDRHAVKARMVINAEGFSLAPGFIDAHSHSEFTLLSDNRAEGKVFQGVTTEINGNCGLSAAPLYGAAQDHREKDLREAGIKERWSTLSEYFGILSERKTALNVASLVGHGNIRASVMGYEDRDTNKAERGQMLTLLEEAVRDGAIGLSTGLIYPPGVYARTGEIIELAHSIKDLLYTSHMRSEGDELIEAIEEVVRIGRESGIPVHISHLKTGGKGNWHKIEDAVSVIEKARHEGIRVTCDRYPYTAASTDLDAVLPSWVYAGGAEEELRRLEDTGVRSTIRNELVTRYADDDSWRRITVASILSESNTWMEGKTLYDISLKMGKLPVDLLLDILVEERLRIGAIFHSMNEDNLRRFLGLPYLVIGSDSSARSTNGPTWKGKPHPRGFGTFPRFLGRYVRDGALMSVHEGIHKMTMLPAQIFGLRHRGQIKKDFYADMVIFDEERIMDRATFEEPFLTPHGISSVFVNGTPVIREGAPTGMTPGRVLRHGE
jgi:N-acyl-D-amino-acid deacylase